MRTPNLSEKFQTMADAANDRLVSRSDEVNTAIVALLSRQHHLQVGPPGTAKSLLADTITAMIGDAEQFSLLLTRQTKVEEVYGPISLQALADEDAVRFNTTGFLPSAHIFFGDEIFKASAALLNTMLWLLNERKFRNDATVHRVPLISGFFGSNEFPEDSRLDALYDRIAFRHWIDDLNDHDAFSTMMHAHMDRTPVEPIVSLADLQAAHAEVDAVRMNDKTIDIMFSIRDDLRRREVVVSSRTMANAISILKASAFLRGDEVVNSHDIGILRHVLWSDVKERKDVGKIVMEHAAPLLKELMELRSDVDTLQAEIELTKKDENAASRQNKAVPHKARLQELVLEGSDLRGRMEAENMKGIQPVLDQMSSLSKEIRQIMTVAQS